MHVATNNGRFMLVLSLYMLHSAYSKGNPNSCAGVEIVTREEWLARPRWRDWTMKTPVNQVIIQHTVTPQCYTKPHCIRTVQSMQNDNMDYKAWGDIAYNFVVGADGRVYEGRGWTMPGAHSINFNTNSIGLAFIGNFNNVEPNKAMLDAAQNLIECGVQKGYLTPTREIHGHRDVSCSESPGDKLYAIIRRWKGFKGGRLPDYYC